MTTKKADPRTVKTKYRIDVTEADIKKGVKSHSAKCVVATAIARQVPEAGSISVDLQTVRFSRQPERKRLVYLTPAEVADYVIDFDAGDDIEPFSFTLERPAYVQEMQAQREGNRVVRTTPKVTEYQIRTDSGIETVTKQAQSGKHKNPIPRTKRRMYGRRLLRVNQDRDKIERGEVDPYAVNGGEPVLPTA